jgi:glyoxylase-like metal-dependent hydrolase (beta-lactamase superfamily II)
MQAIAADVYIETAYPGVTLGVIRRPQGLLLIDAPLSLEGARAWRAALMNLGGGPDRLLINLDAHPDRTIGTRAMDCTVIAHERTAQIFRNRPLTFKAGAEETGAEWEMGNALPNIRWAPPELSFTRHLKIYWDDLPVLVEHHPGPASGACWVIVPDSQVVFVGDAVIAGQPPFLASANIPLWLEALNLLLTSPYQAYQIVSGRGGVVSSEAVREQIACLTRIYRLLEEQARQKPSSTALEEVVKACLEDFPARSAEQQRQYLQRLRHGLTRYYHRHYHTSSATAEEE